MISDYEGALTIGASTRGMGSFARVAGSRQKPDDGRPLCWLPPPWAGYTKNVTPSRDDSGMGNGVSGKSVISELFPAPASTSLAHGTTAAPNVSPVVDSAGMRKGSRRVGELALPPAVPAASPSSEAAPAPAQNVTPSRDDSGMGNGVLTAAEVAGIHASVTALNALFRDDAQLRNVVDGTGPDVLQRAYELRLERLGVVARLEAQIAALKARDAAEAVELQNAMTPPDARLQERTFREISVVEEIAGILTISSGAAGAFVTQARRV